MDFIIFVWNTLTGDVVELIGYCCDVINKRLWSVIYQKFDYAGWFNQLDRFFK